MRWPGRYQGCVLDDIKELLLTFCFFHTLKCVRLFCDLVACHRLLCPWDSLGKNAGVGCHFLLYSPVVF